MTGISNYFFVKRGSGVIGVFEVEGRFSKVTDMGNCSIVIKPAVISMSEVICPTILLAIASTYQSLSEQ